VPQVLAVGRRFLALEWIEPGPSGPAAQHALGAALATLHRSGAPAFGLGYDNMLATLAQRNGEHASWPAFWVEHRIAPLVDLALARGRGEASWPAAVERLRRRAAELWPDEPPARLHGDLWSGNVLFAARGPTIVDPAVYGGHREIDLAMLALFGGLHEETVAAYQATYPLCPGWRARQPLAQLYPLLAHAVLFGGGYRAQADALLRRL
jgi:fructosamine-3-kinase